MARMDLRLRAWGAVTRRQTSVATRTEADVIALQSRKIPEGGLLGRILGQAVPGTIVGDRSIPGPGGDLPVRVYAPAPAGVPSPVRGRSSSTSTAAGSSSAAGCGWGTGSAARSPRTSAPWS